MNNIYVFFNNRIVEQNFSPISRTSSIKVSFSDVSVPFGDWCLTPVRCLFNGNKVTISIKGELLKVDHNNDNASSQYDYDWESKRYLRVIASLILIIPGLIIGSFFKGLGYLSQSVREHHNRAVQHFTPVDYTVGSPENRLNLVQIREQLKELIMNNHLNRPTKNLIIFAEKGTQIKEDPGILSLCPEKLIMDGAEIIHGSSHIGCLDEELDFNWEKRICRVVHAERLDNSSFVIQWKIKTVSAALKDIPPKKSMFSFKRYNRIYVII